MIKVSNPLEAEIGYQIVFPVNNCLKYGNIFMLLELFWRKQYNNNRCRTTYWNAFIWKPQKRKKEKDVTVTDTVTVKFFSPFSFVVFPNKCILLSCLASIKEYVNYNYWSLTPGDLKRRQDWLFCLKEAYDFLVMYQMLKFTVCELTTTPCWLNNSGCLINSLEQTD